MLNHGAYSDLTAEQYELLGRAFVEWSNIEFLLGILLSRLLYTPEFLGRTYSDELSAVKLESAIINALDIHHRRYADKAISDELNQRILHLIKRASSCRALRNKFAHYVWMRRSDDAIFGTKMSGKLPKQKGKGDSVIIAMEELSNNYKEAHSVAKEIGDIVLDMPSIKEDRESMWSE